MSNRRAYPTDPNNALYGDHTYPAPQQQGGVAGPQQSLPLPPQPQPVGVVGTPMQNIQPGTYSSYQAPQGGVNPQQISPNTSTYQQQQQPPPSLQPQTSPNNPNTPGGSNANTKRMYPVDPDNSASLTHTMANMNIGMNNQNSGLPTPNGYPISNQQQQQQGGYNTTNTNIPYNASTPTNPTSPYPQQQQPLFNNNNQYTQPQPTNYNTGYPQPQPNTVANPSYPQQPQNYQPSNPMPNYQPQPTNYNTGYPQPQPNTVANPSYPQQPQSNQPMPPYSGQPQVNTYQDVIPTPENLCPKSFMRMSINAVPNLPATLGKIHIPFGCNIQPLAIDDQNPVPLVSSNIVRCKRVSCKAYINPFVTWVDGGGRWKCNVCDLLNEVTQEYYSPIDLTTGKRVDIASRPELQKGAVEFLATREYTTRAPQPPSYFFVIDVCFESIVSGMLNCAIESIKATLDNLPGDTRTRIGFLTFDDSLHFYNLKANSNGKPQMIVVTEMDNIFVPPFDDFLVNLKESRNVVDNLLELIKNMDRKQQKVESCLGTALKAAFQITHRVGGKIIVLQSYIPRGPFGKLLVRDFQPMLGTKKESQLLQPNDGGDFYKEFGLSCSSHQLSVDVFLFATGYVDTASLGCMAQITGGSLYYYPSFIASRDGETFAANLIHTLTRPTGWEAVMRVRTSRQLNINVYHGNYFLKSSDLLSLPAIDSDKTFALQMSVNDNIPNKFVAIQAALLYTHSNGERRVRVLTTSVPVVHNLIDLFKAADIAVVASLISKMAIDKALSSSLGDAREAIANKCVDILTAYKSAISTNSAGANSVTLSSNTPKLLLPETLKHLPLYVVAMVKNIIFTSRQTHPDARAFHMQRLKAIDLVSCLNFFYPQFYNLLRLPTDPQQQSADQDHLPTLQSLPATLKLSADQLSRAGVFIIVTGYSIYLFVGENIDANTCHELFGCDFASINPATFQNLPIIDSNTSRYARKIIEMARTTYPEYMRIILVKSNDRQRFAEFQSLLVEDRAEEGGSYYEFIVQLQNRIQQNK